MSEERNIVTVSVNTFIDIIGTLYVNAIRENAISKLPSVFLWGPPGVGKSDAVKEIADRIADETGKKVVFTDIRLLLFSPVDLRGIPYADEEHQFTQWLKPKIFDLCDDLSVVNIIDLEELSAAPPAVQAAAYQLTLEKKLGEFKLPDNTLVIASGNRTTDHSVAYRMPHALANRMLHLDIVSEFESWRMWAVTHGINPLVLGYLSFDNSKLCAEGVDIDEVAFPTPRSWEQVSNILNLSKERSPSELHPLIAGLIGKTTAFEFEIWCRVLRNMPSVDDIFAGRRTEYPQSYDVLYALISSMTTYIMERRESISNRALENGCSYALKFPPDFANKFFMNLLCDKDMKLKLMKITEFQKWMKKSGRK